MHQFLVTTTGTLDPVIFLDLGGFFLNHPTVDRDLTIEFSMDELINSEDVLSALNSGHITIQDENGIPINETTLEGGLRIVSASENDSEPGFLNQKISGNGGIDTGVIPDGFGGEKLEIAVTGIDSAPAFSTMIADGAGENAWAKRTEQSFTIATNGDTVFNLMFTPLQDDYMRMMINGTDYTHLFNVVGNTITYTGGDFALETTDNLRVRYHYL